MIRKLIYLVCIIIFLYVLTFDIFLTKTITIPIVVLGAIMGFVFKQSKTLKLNFFWEITFVFLANLFYYAISQGEFKQVIVNTLIIGSCALYFNYFVGNSTKRLNTSVIVFIGLLAISTIVMFFDHLYPIQVFFLREALVDAPVMQSPAGISTTIFTFGYQVTAFSTFIFLYAMLKTKNYLLIILSLTVALVAIFYGMQRSALMAFMICSLAVIIFYYKAKAIPVLVGIGIVCIGLFSVIETYNTDTQSNILNKNEKNAEMGDDRGGLVFENLKIYSSYPFGLLFYGKTWKDVTRDSATFRDGLTSHNAYLMFITYLGPFLGLFILGGIFYRFYKATIHIVNNISEEKYALAVCLCFTLIAVCLNSMFHNGWLVNGNGPTVFLLFAALQQFYILQNKEVIEPVKTTELVILKPKQLEVVKQNFDPIQL